MSWVRSKKLVIREMELQLQANDERIRQLETFNDFLKESLNSISDGLVICDQQGQIVMRNDTAEVFFEARHGDVLVEQAIHEVLEAALSDEFAHQDLDLIGPPQRMISLSAHPLSSDERRLGLVVIIEDVSERRRLEEVRKDFVANISHELKTPVGALGLLAETISTEDDMTVMRRLSQRLTGEAFRVSRMIDDLLDLSRIEDEESSQLERVPLGSLISAAVERVESLSKERSISIDLQEVSQEIFVLADPRQLISAISNLLENACKYSDELSVVKVKTTCENSWAEISVSDKGIGIPARDLERIFERFYRVDRARSRETGGTGLGLSIVRHVMSNHGGRVTVESVEGEGSVFCLQLPLGDFESLRSA